MLGRFIDKATRTLPLGCTASNALEWYDRKRNPCSYNKHSNEPKLFQQFPSADRKGRFFFKFNIYLKMFTTHFELNVRRFAGIVGSFDAFIVRCLMQLASNTFSDECFHRLLSICYCISLVVEMLSIECICIQVAIVRKGCWFGHTCIFIAIVYWTFSLLFPLTLPPLSLFLPFCAQPLSLWSPFCHFSSSIVRNIHNLCCVKYFEYSVECQQEGVRLTIYLPIVSAFASPSFLYMGKCTDAFRLSGEKKWKCVHRPQQIFIFIHKFRFKWMLNKIYVCG